MMATVCARRGKVSLALTLVLVPCAVEGVAPGIHIGSTRK